MTVRAWAAAGRIPYSKTLGGHRRFDIAEVCRVLDHGVLPERYSAAVIASRIAGEIERLPPTESPYHEDAPLRAIIDLRDALRRAGPEGFKVLTAIRPALVGDARWDSFVAAVVEDEAERKALPIPAWVDDPRRLVEPEWYVAPYPQLFEAEKQGSPAAYLRHGVIASEESLTSV